MRWSIYQADDKPVETALQEITGIIELQIKNQPRSLQKRIGPSEIGMDCTHCLAAKLAGWEKDDPGTPWASTIGTGAHMLMESFFDRFTQMHYRPERGARFLTEEKVAVGKLGATPITGSTDLLDVETGLTVDWKFVGERQLQKYRSQGPSDQYRVQAHLYAHGWNNSGVTVRHVSICFLPRTTNRFNDHFWWHEPYDPQIATSALDRLNAVWDALQVKVAAGTAARDEWISSLPRAENCWDCRKYPDYPKPKEKNTPLQATHLTSDIDTIWAPTDPDDYPDLNTIADYYWDLRN